eukprot:793949_1
MVGLRYYSSEYGSYTSTRPTMTNSVKDNGYNLSIQSVLNYKQRVSRIAYGTRVMRYLFTSYYVFSLCVGLSLIILQPTHKLDALNVPHEMKLILAIVGVDVGCFYRIFHHNGTYCAFQTWFATGHLLYALCTTKWVLTYSGLHVPSID